MRIDEIPFPRRPELTLNDKRGLENLDRILRRDYPVEKIKKQLENDTTLKFNIEGKINSLKYRFIDMLQQGNIFNLPPERVLNRMMSRFGEEVNKISKILDQIDGKETEYEGTFKKGMASLGKVQKRKVTAILDALPLIERKVGSKITWKTMKWKLIFTYGQTQGWGGFLWNEGGSIGLGSKVDIIGYTRDGTEIKYMYKQSRAAQSGQRMYKIGKNKQEYISRLANAEYMANLRARKQRDLV